MTAPGLPVRHVRHWRWTGFQGNTLWGWLDLLLVPFVLPAALTVLSMNVSQARRRAEQAVRHESAARDAATGREAGRPTGRPPAAVPAQGSRSGGSRDDRPGADHPASRRSATEEPIAERRLAPIGGA